MNVIQQRKPMMMSMIQKTILARYNIHSIHMKKQIVIEDIPTEDDNENWDNIKDSYPPKGKENLNNFDYDYV